MTTSSSLLFLRSGPANFKGEHPSEQRTKEHTLSSKGIPLLLIDCNPWSSALPSSHKKCLVGEVVVVRHISGTVILQWIYGTSKKLLDARVR